MAGAGAGAGVDAGAAAAAGGAAAAPAAPAAPAALQLPQASKTIAAPEGRNDLQKHAAQGLDVPSGPY